MSNKPEFNCVPYKESIIVFVLFTLMRQSGICMYMYFVL